MKNNKLLKILLPALVLAAVLCACEAATNGSNNSGGEETSEIQETVDTQKEETLGEADVQGEDAPEDVNSETDEAAGDADDFETIFFGNYEQDNDTGNGAEPIEWYVLARTDDEAILLAVNNLDNKVYQSEQVWITWEECDLRSWLNNDFYNTAFNEDEKAAILDTNLINNDNPYVTSGTVAGGNDTVDKVWLLSTEEVDNYFGVYYGLYDSPDGDTAGKYAQAYYNQDHRLIARTTAYAESHGAMPETEDSVKMQDILYGVDAGYSVGGWGWWLRSPGFHESYACYVNNWGGVDYDGTIVNFDFGVRPAIKVSSAAVQ